MKATTIPCPKCGHTLSVSDAIQSQIMDELQKQKAEQSELLRKEYESLAEQKAQAAVQSALEKQKQQSETELEKMKLSLELAEQKAKDAAELAADKEKAKAELENAKLLSQIAAERESNQELQKKLTGLIDELSKATKERDTAELKAKEQLHARENEIREEAKRTANDENYTKIREQEERIRKLSEQLSEAKQVADESSQRLIGEVLELDVERDLRVNFPLDSIKEVKVGERGSDIRQFINEQHYQNCGLILWECKNTKSYSGNWLVKLKDEVEREKAQFGIIVLNSSEGEDFKQLADNIWLVKPRYAVMLGAFLREICIKVTIANRNAENKDVKVDLLYNYLTGDEFKRKIQNIIESYDEMAKQLENEKRQTMKRWSTQDKILQKVTKSLYCLGGDLEGIAGKEIIALPESDEEIA